MMTNQTKFKKGFGILEVLVSSVIIIVILAALVFISRAAMANSTYTQQRSQAIYLAQEGIEIVRQIRDTNWIDGSSSTQWDTIKLNSANAFVQVTTGDLVPVLYNSTRFGLMDINAATSGFAAINIEGSAGTTGTDFTRKITISKIPETATSPLPKIAAGDATDVHKDINAIKATAEVSWDYNGSHKTIDVSEIITNWRPNY